VTIFGGLVSATALDAILTPLLFRRFGRVPLERLREERTASNATQPSEVF
jgi:HME family heavy-metal exporter